MLIITISVIILVTLMISVERYGLAVVLMTLFLLSTSIYPKVFSPPTFIPHVGIAPQGPNFTTYGLLLLAALLLQIAYSGLTRSLLLYLPFVAYIGFGVLSIWEGSPEQVSGALHLLQAPIAWSFGVFCAAIVHVNTRFRYSMTTVILAIIGIQLFACTIQVLGLPFNRLDASQQELLAGRFNGTLGHPNDLGKIMVLLLICLLPLLSGAESRITKKWGLVGVVTIFAVLALTGGRAVLIGALMIPLIWILLSPPKNGSAKIKLTVILCSALASLTVLGILAARFEEDPEGGDRSGLLDVAVGQIARTPWTGVGPNSYVTAVGYYSPLTASGVPVHNSFLLAIVELGIVGGALLVLPVVVVMLACLRNIGRDSLHGSFARIGISMIPTIILIGMTGWGLMGNYVFPLLFFVFGLIYGGVTHKFKRAENWAYGGRSGRMRSLL